MDYRTGTVVQIAYIVDDVRRSALEFHRTTGAGPFFVRKNLIPSAWGPALGPGSEREIGTFDHTSAYGQWGRIQVELVVPHTAGPAAFAATTTESRHRVHHVAMMVDDVAAEQKRLTLAGCPALLTAETGGTDPTEFAFHDARATLGHLIEIYEPSERILRLYRTVAEASVGWDGRDPVRDV